ncbi:DUF5946 family protein [Devosia sp. YR412]|uniref:DUF5946 family protein n=1 Tax=Devosia sp. YR412 TaxID=1881030 RepID=UPI00244E6E98|nr:DUF5946 family protein [Devosia sp. YR412]
MIREACPGCGGSFEQSDGPVHAYMASSPACFAAFGAVLAVEYSSPDLQATHRLTVDTWAVQHVGDPKDRRAVQSVGLHLSRLYLQLATPRTPIETNAVMLDFSRFKQTLKPLVSPGRFAMTVADIVPVIGSDAHPGVVREWAMRTWSDWSDQHAYIRDWVVRNGRYGGGA